MFKTLLAGKAGLQCKHAGAKEMPAFPKKIKRLEQEKTVGPFFK